MLSVRALYMRTTATVWRLPATSAQTASDRVALTAFQRTDCTHDLVQGVFDRRRRRM